jgi:hypothetical protein
MFFFDYFILYLTIWFALYASDYKQLWSYILAILGAQDRTTV